MRLSLSTDSRGHTGFYSAEESRNCCDSLRFLQTVAFSKLRALEDSFTKPIDGLYQRFLKILPPFSYVVHRAHAFFFPFSKRYWAHSFYAIELLRKIHTSSQKSPLSPQEISVIGEFFSKIQKHPSSLWALNAFSNAKEYALLVFIQGILRHGDGSHLEEKLDRMLQGQLSVHLTVEELGMIETSTVRMQFLQELQDQGVKDLQPILSFWSKMAELRFHPMIRLLKERTIAQFQDDCLGFVSSYEDDKKFRFNLKGDSLRFVSPSSMAYYLLVGNISHVGLAFVQEGKPYISDIVPPDILSTDFEQHQSHGVRPHETSILYPSLYLFRFSVRPLLASHVSAKDAYIVERVFARTLKGLASSPQKVRWDFLTGLSAYLMGIKTPAWDREKAKKLQSKEICTGYTAKLVYQAFLKARDKLCELGYKKEDIDSPFLPHENMGRLLVSDFIKHFKKKKMIEWVEDPLLKACIEPGVLRAELRNL